MKNMTFLANKENNQNTCKNIPEIWAHKVIKHAGVLCTISEYINTTAPESLMERVFKTGFTISTESSVFHSFELNSLKT